MREINKFIDNITSLKIREVQNISSNVDKYFQELPTKNYLLNNQLLLDNAKSLNTIYLLDAMLDKGYILSQNNNVNAISNALESWDSLYVSGGNDAADVTIKASVDKMNELERTIMAFVEKYNNQLKDVKSKDLSDFQMKKQIAVLDEQNKKLVTAIIENTRRASDFIKVLKQ
ncbi:hypothetical protein nvc1_073 [Namao virus]|nr:hypothetical protein nvc1_073 [Namao virus]